MTTININPELLCSACKLAIEYVENHREKAYEDLITRMISYQQQGWFSKLLGREWFPPTREEIADAIENHGMGGYDYRVIQHRYGATLNTAKSLLAAIEVSEPGPISIGFEEFKQLQTFFPEASK